MKLEVVHETQYRYTGLIAETVMELRLRPMDGNGQRCVKFDLDVSSGLEPRSYPDGYGNYVHYFNLVRPHASLNLIGKSAADTRLEPDAQPGAAPVQAFPRSPPPPKDVPGSRDLPTLH